MYKNSWARLLVERKIVAHIFVISLIFLVTYMFLRNSTHIWDLQMWDETFYMATGVFNWDHHFRFYEVSPLYSYLYRIASFYITDTASLHLWMGVIVIALAVLVTSISVMVISRNVAFTSITMVVMISSGYSAALPKLVYVAISIMAMGLAFATLMRSFHSKLACITLFAFLVSFIRPEFVITFYIAGSLSLFSLLWYLRRPSQDPMSLGITFIILAIIGLLCKLWVFPILSGGARALQAFGQHYSLYLFNIGEVKIDPFFNYEKILQEYLPGANSEADALRLYPQAMLGFFFYNIKNCVLSAFGAFYGIIVNNTIIALAICVLAAFCGARRKRGLFNWGNFVCWIVLAIPTAISIVLIFARDHYLVVAATLLMLLCGMLVRSFGVRDTYVGAVGVLLLSVFLVQPLPPRPQPNLDVVEALRSQPAIGAMLELDGGWCYYAPSKCYSVFALDVKINNMVDYLDNAHINGVMASPALIGWAKETGKNDLSDFLQHTPPGWSRIALSENYVLIRRNVIDSEGWGNVLTAGLLNYVQNSHVGRETGIISKKGNASLFIHPGASDSTTFTLDVPNLTVAAGCSAVTLWAHIDDKVPPRPLPGAELLLVSRSSKAAV